MFEYGISDHADENIFTKQCKVIEKYYPNAEKLKLMQDVDDSKIQRYNVDGKNITVYNSYYLDEVYVKSEIDLTDILTK